MGERVDRTSQHAAADKSDAVLVAEMHVPESDALGALFRRYIRLVRRVAVDILRDEAEAEDVAQEVFFEIYRKAHQYDPSRGAVRVWLLQYAYHRSLRRKDVLRRRVAYRSEPLDEVDAPTTDGRCGNRVSLTREECRLVIRRGLDQLPERQRKTLELACLQELSLRDVAARLSVSLGCARHYYYRGIARLRAWAQRASQASHDRPPSQRQPMLPMIDDAPRPRVRRDRQSPSRRVADHARTVRVSKALDAAHHAASEGDTAGAVTRRAPRRRVRT
jgi:RNA polymerase sigma-70 factor (ECF subfamily)